MTSRERFEAHYKHLDMTLNRDAWDREIYAHSHVEAMWDGWQAAERSALERAAQICDENIDPAEAAFEIRALLETDK
ncbi:hypothetical protein [Caballeronia sp. LZ035]|uniref:hypothetical protein n=1 Tax=Caballeronia sp. LZ035 TaxID=3038568 RepID=UPI00285D5F04|nr:hypothetical protein [Caballeronia sp. LZ035]MDR5756978.1 hypothetical protein [Caballeronia sp. LZ035]